MALNKRQLTERNAAPRVMSTVRAYIPVPPLAEQHRMIAKVYALKALCDRLEASLDSAATTRRRTRSLAAALSDTRDKLRAAAAE